MDKHSNGDAILIVDDNERLFASLVLNLKQRGFAAEWAGDGATAERKLSAKPFVAVFLDLALGDESGLDLLPRLLTIRPRTPVIIITGFGTFDAAVKATKLGARDFLPKPLDIDKLLEVLKNAIGSGTGDTPAGAPGEAAGMVCVSPAMLKLCEKARMVADSPLPVLITGESGTGKELMAKYVHRHSSRKDGAFVSINCSAIADSLSDSELFGHAKGAFTGAAAERAGVFEQADGGTLHMDEVGDMSPGIQAKILRVLEDAKIRRVGENGDRTVDVRLIASTNKDLPDCIEAGTFRRDLFYRLNAAHLRLPPLRERRDDIPALLAFFLGRVAERGAGKRFSSGAMEMLVNYDWPGNIRELRNLVKISTLTTPGAIIEPEDIPASFNLRKETKKSVRLSDNERECIVRALREAGGNKMQAAQMLGISRRTLYNKLERYAIG